MELKNQIKKYRASMNLSQEELAEKVYVTRQTVSNWETGKSYPDIHSLLLLSSLFDISLDQLIKGDIDIMKKEINETEVKRLNHMGTIFCILLLATVVLFLPLVLLWEVYGFIIWAVVFGMTMIWAIRLEKVKKNNNIRTYKDIVAFMEGKQLDEIQK